MIGIIVSVTTAKNNPEGKHENTDSSSERSVEADLVVKQPPQLESVMVMLNDLEKVTEVVREDKSQDMGSGSVQGVTGSGSGGVSLRDQSIKSLPSIEVMRTRLTHHLQREVKQLERKAKRMGRSAQKGSAYLLNELFAKIRRIQALIMELMDAAADVVRRLYIRLFIDQQQLV